MMNAFSLTIYAASSSRFFAATVCQNILVQLLPPRIIRNLFFATVLSLRLQKSLLFVSCNCSRVKSALDSI